MRRIPWTSLKTYILIPWIMFDRDYDMHALGSEVADLFINAIMA